MGNSCSHWMFRPKLQRMRTVHDDDNYADTYLVGGFHPVEKYGSKLESSPIFGVKIKKIEKPPPSYNSQDDFWSPMTSSIFGPESSGRPAQQWCSLSHPAIFALKRAVGSIVPCRWIRTPSWIRHVIWFKSCVFLVSKIRIYANTNYIF